MCCDAITGDMLWAMDMKKTFGTEIPFWYTGQCPYISEAGTLVLAPAGKETLMVGVDCSNGEVKWSTPNTIDYKMSHSSVMPMTIGGKKMYVYAGVGGVCGVSADGDDEGRVLWSTSKWQPSVVAPSPLQLNSTQAFLVAGYGAGGALLQVDKSGNGWNADIKEQYKADKGLSCEQQTPILYNGMIILKSNNVITGLTTAAGVWTTGAIGIAIGYGFYQGAIVVSLLFLITIVLFIYIF